VRISALEATSPLLSSVPVVAGTLPAAMAAAVAVADAHPSTPECKSAARLTTLPAVQALLVKTSALAATAHLPSVRVAAGTLPAAAATAAAEAAPPLTPECKSAGQLTTPPVAQVLLVRTSALAARATIAHPPSSPAAAGTPPAVVVATAAAAVAAPP
jgi:hypothetical protein